MAPIVLWDLDDDPDGNVQHIGIDEIWLSKSDVEHAVEHAEWLGMSRSTARPILMGPTRDFRRLVVVYEEIGDDMIYPITAFLVDE